MVLSNDNVTINQELREAFDNNWVLNEVNYITEDEYEPLSWTEEIASSFTRRISR